MEIRNNSNIGFRARLLPNKAFAEVLHSGKNKYIPAKFACVQFYPNDDNDFKALRNAGRYWINGYAGNIEYSAEEIRFGLANKRKTKIFGVTAQPDNFEKIDDTKLLLLCEIENVTKNILRIAHIQACPDITGRIQPAFKHIGTGFINILKKMYPAKIIVAKSAYSATGFYEKNGFSIIDTKELLYMYLPKAIKTGKIKPDFQ